MNDMAPKTTLWTYGGIRNVVLDVAHDFLELGSGFSLIKPNDVLLSARHRYFMSEEEYKDAETVGTYLLYKSQQPANLPEKWDESLEVFQHGVMALQILKPVRTLGFVYQSSGKSGAAMSPGPTTHRPPTDAGQWARMRSFDSQFLSQVPDLIPKICQVMRGTNAEERNSIILLQLGLEQPHPLIAGLLCIMGMEARFDSVNRNDFEKKLCGCLGEATLVFPDWNSPDFPQPKYTVGELAIPIYMLRNKLAHGADLRKASMDKSTPVDLTKKVDLIPELEPRANAFLLSEAAIYLLCQVLQKCL
ncbi:MAG: hypothetical protein WAN65_18710 [Candidatus Sulfotelmatobacter sp.]